uniref:Peroxisomal ATPase PEX1 n=1 Tax=Parastrongyloides trichosuri TaxID=131310 RepID=A0A0N4ZS76_PARTI
MEVLQEIIELLKDSVEKICELHEANKKLSNPIPLVLAFVGIENCDQIYAINRVSNLLSYQLIEMDIYDLWNNDKNCFDVKLFENFLMIHSFTPCIITIKNIGIIGDKDNENEYDLLIIEKIVNFINTLTSSVIVIFIVTFSEYTTFPLLLKNKLLYEIVLPTIKEEDRFKFFSHFYSKELSIYLASNTLGYSCNELKQVICDTNFFRKLEQSLENKKSFKNEKIYFDKAIEKRNKSLSVAFTVPSIPNVKWKDIGGLEETKLILQESLGINSKNYYNVKRSGIVLYGPPGCGKTLIAKAVANEFNTTFISVKGPELLNQYIGQSEENVRKLFEKARQASPCIIFFDEMDSLCPSQGRSSDSGGVMDRIVSQLLTELDTVNNNPDCQVFVIAATNRPDLLNQSLLSPGRFDKTVYIKAAEDVETKVKVLEAVSRKIKLSDDIELTKIASLCPNVMSGADLYSLMSNAVMESIRENIKLLERDNVDSRNLDNNEKFKIVVSIKHIIKSLEMNEKIINMSKQSILNLFRKFIIIIYLLIEPIFADTCLNSGKLAGLIFGSIFGTLVICLSIALFIWFLTNKHKKAEKVLILERAHATIETDSNFSDETPEVSKLEKGIGTDHVSIKSHTSLRDNQMITDLKMKNIEERASSGIESDEGTRSIDSLYQSMKDIGNMDKASSNKISKLGFSISPNDIEGIKILEVEKDGPASQSGNIFEGDRIKHLTISFENMLYEDAIKLLHYSSPYLIKLDLERVSPLKDIENDTSISESFTINITPKTMTPEVNEFSNKDIPIEEPNSSQEIKVVDGIIQNNCVIITSNIEKEMILESSNQINPVERSKSTSSATTVSSAEFNDAEKSFVVEFSKVCQTTSHITPAKMELIEQKEETPKKSNIVQRTPSIKSRPPSPSRLPTPTKSPRRLTDTNIRIPRTPSIKDIGVRKLTFENGLDSSTSDKSSPSKSMSNSSNELTTILTPISIGVEKNCQEPPKIDVMPIQDTIPPPEIKLMKVQTIKRLDTPPQVAIVERELPPLPQSTLNILNDKSDEKINLFPGKMYLEMKEKLRNVYKDPILQVENVNEKASNKKDEINKEHCQELLEKNKKIIDEQREELRSLGLNVE